MWEGFELAWLPSRKVIHLEWEAGEWTHTVYCGRCCSSALFRMWPRRRDGHLSWGGLGKTTAQAGEGLRVERGLKDKILGREEKRLPDGGNKKVCRHRVGGTPSLCD